MEGLEYVRNQIVKLKDDLQHYTMVEKDSALASQIRYDLEQFETIEKELKEYEQYKAIEQELGIDFITLIKALREGFVDGNGEYHHFSNLFIDNIEIFDSYEKVSFYLNDYGKTWALTKEELEQ